MAKSVRVYRGPQAHRGEPPKTRREEEKTKNTRNKKLYYPTSRLGGSDGSVMVRWTRGRGAPQSEIEFAAVVNKRVCAFTRKLRARLVADAITLHG